MDNYESAVFVSYAWGGESEYTVDELEKAFAKRGIRIVRDKKDVNYKDSIKAFEQRLGEGHCIVLVISDKSLRSEHCMYELLEADKNQNLCDRIFPIVLADARIHKAIDRVDYIRYWDTQIEKLNQAVKGVGVMTNLASVMADLDKYARIRASFDHLTDLLSDMNALTPEMHAADDFSILINAVQQEMAKNEPAPVGDTPKPGKTHQNPTGPKTSAALLEQLRSPGDARNRFVGALLQCNSMADPAARQHIISQLPSDIKLNIGAPNAGPKVQVSHIVQICLNYENGIQSLVQAIEAIEGNSLPVQNVKKLLGLG